MPSTASTQPWRTEQAQPSATEWLSLLAAGELSARELAEHYLARLSEADERVHAVVSSEPEAVLEAATEADLARRAGQTKSRCSDCR